MATVTTEKEWVIRHPDPLLQQRLSDTLKVHPIVAQLLVNRSVTDIEEARRFLYPNSDGLHDPFLFKDMDKAVVRIQQAMEQKERVMVFGDYDVDGVTSSALLNKALKKLGIDVVHYIPHRMHEGYGLNHDVADLAKEQGVKLLITVDCGISAREEVDSINKAGIDVIIFDHHEPPEQGPPDAVAVVDPKRKDCPYPFKHLASVGLMAKLHQALFGKVEGDILDLVALGTIADVVPLRGENRIFVKHGLPRITVTKNVGLSALMDVAKIKGKPIKPYYVGFILGPRINAMGRMDSAHRALDLLLTEDENEAYALAKELDRHNTRRQKMQRDVVDDALKVIDEDFNLDDHPVLVVGKEGWHKGVLGIVASRLVDKYSRPSIVISFEDGVGTASARSVEGFHLHEALTHCAQTLDNFGGHKLAAGLTIREGNIEPFRNLINDFARDILRGQSWSLSLNIDCEVPLSVLDLKFVQIVNSLEPYGEGNPEPVFCSRNLIVKSPPRVMGKDTLKFWVTDGQMSVSAVGFGMARYKDLIRLGTKIDLAYQLTIDDWNKPPAVQLKLKDIRESKEA